MYAVIRAQSNCHSHPHLIAIGRQKQAYPLSDFVAHSGERLTLLGDVSLCRIIQPPMDRIRTGKHRAMLSSTVTHGDNEVKVLPEVNAYVFRFLMPDLDAQVSHDLDSHRM